MEKCNIFNFSFLVFVVVVLFRFHHGVSVSVSRQHQLSHPLSVSHTQQPIAAQAYTLLSNQEPGSHCYSGHQPIGDMDYILWTNQSRVLQLMQCHCRGHEVPPSPGPARENCVVFSRLFVSRSVTDKNSFTRLL